MCSYFLHEHWSPKCEHIAWVDYTCLFIKKVKVDSILSGQKVHFQDIIPFPQQYVLYYAYTNVRHLLYGCIVWGNTGGCSELRRDRRSCHSSPRSIRSKWGEWCEPGDEHANGDATVVTFACLHTHHPGARTQRPLHTNRFASFARSRARKGCVTFSGSDRGVTPPPPPRP